MQAGQNTEPAALTVMAHNPQPSGGCHRCQAERRSSDGEGDGHPRPQRPGCALVPLLQGEAHEVTVLNRQPDARPPGRVRRTVGDLASSAGLDVRDAGVVVHWRPRCSGRPGSVPGFRMVVVSSLARRGARASWRSYLEARCRAEPGGLLLPYSGRRVPDPAPL